MTSSNPMVAGAIDTTTPFQGAFLLEDGEALTSAIRSGDWVSGGFAAFGAAMDTVATVSDPLGSLIAAGLGWLMEHMQPLKGWLNDLTGDSGEVAGFAQTWTNVGAQLRQSSADLTSVLGDLDAADGAAVRAYLAFQRDVAEHLNGAASWADGMATGMQMASTIVQVVHDMVRDSLAQLVGSLISYAAELLFTLGLATPLVIEQASTRVAALAAKFSKKIPDLVAAIRKLGELVEKLKALIKRFGEVAENALRGKGGTGSAGSHAGSSPPVSQPNFDQGVRFFGEEQLPHYTNPEPTLGRPGGAVFMMPYEDAMKIDSPAQAMFESGMANSVTNAVQEGKPVYAAVIDTSGLPQRLPTAADAGDWPHFLPGGRTAINIDGHLFPNATREFVVDGGTVLPLTVLYQVHDTGLWQPLGIALGK